MNIKIYRDPNSDAGGAASAATSSEAASASTSAGGAVAPNASPEANPMMNFAAGLAKSLAKTPSASLPASDGKKTDAAATATEGDAGGDDDSKDPGTTADADPEAGEAEEQEGAESETEWSKEELKTLEAMKATLPFTPESRTVLKSLRDTRAQLDRVSASNTNAISRSQELEAALHAGDAKALQALGFDLKLDQRTPDKMIEELEGEFNVLADAMKPVLGELAKLEDGGKALGMVKSAVQKVLNRYNDKAAVITREQERQSLKDEVLREAGVKKDAPNSYKVLSDKAKSHLQALVQEDPKANENFKLLEKYTSHGGPLHALGITLARAYGTNMETARMANKLAAGLELIEGKRNVKAILTEDRRKQDKDRMKRAPTSKVGGDSGAPASSGSGIHSRLASAMAAMARR